MSLIRFTPGYFISLLCKIDFFSVPTDYSFIVLIMSLVIIMGPMFSGKTSRLISMYQTLRESGEERICVVNYLGNLRYGNTSQELVSHDQTKIPCISCRTLAEIPATTSYKYLLVNEAQFFGDLRQFILEAVEDRGIHVCLFGLDGDYKRRPMGQLLELIPYCDRVEKHTAICMGLIKNVAADTECGVLCSKPAIFTYRHSNETEVFVIGSHDKYQPLCRDCYTNNYL